MIDKSINDEGGDEPGKLFVGGLSWETTEEKLQQYFSAFGEIIDSLIMKNTESGQSRGFGFITFADPKSAKEVLSKGPHVLDGRAIDPKPCNTKNSVKSKRSAQFPKVFLGGLPFNVTETDIRTAFSRYGNVVDVIIMYDHEKNKCRGFGFLSFEDDSCIDKCVADHFVYVNGKKVEVKRAEPRDGKGGVGSGASLWGGHSQNGDHAGLPSYPGWGAAPTSAYGYGTPAGGPVAYAGWGAPVPGQWGPSAYGPAPGYGSPYGPPAMPYAQWNWSVQGQNGSVSSAVVPTGASSSGVQAVPTSDQYGQRGTSGSGGSSSTKSQYAGYGGYAGGYAGTYQESAYTNPASRGGYSAGSESYSGADTSTGHGAGHGPQRSSSTQASYHPYRRV